MLTWENTGAGDRDRTGMASLEGGEALKRSKPRKPTTDPLGIDPTHESGQPVHVAMRLGMVDRPTGQPIGKFASHRASPGRESALQREHHRWCDRSSARGSVELGYEVDYILGDDDPLLGSCAIEHLVVGTAGETEIADVPCVVSLIGQVPGDRRAEHLIYEKPHEARKRCRSRAACSARSAANPAEVETMIDRNEAAAERAEQAARERQRFLAT